jgi:hypothetical protein
MMTCVENNNSLSNLFFLGTFFKLEKTYENLPQFWINRCNGPWRLVCTGQTKIRSARIDLMEWR